MKPIHIGIFGCGYIAQRAYLPLLTSWPNVSVAGVFSRSASTLHQMSVRWPHLPVFQDVTQLRDEGITAAFVLTPVESHFQICLNLLEAGIHVFVEKPPTARAEETLRLAQLATGRKLVFMVGFNRRFAPLVQRAKSLCEKEAIQLCVFEKHRPKVQKRGLAETYREDLIHQIDLLRYLCGESTPLYTAVNARQETLFSSASVLQTQYGGLGVLLSSRESGRWQERLSIQGGDTSVELEMFAQLIVRRGEQEIVYGHDRPGTWISHLEERGFSAEIQHFFECIRDEREPLTNGFEAAKSQELQEAVVRAAEQ